MKIRRFWRTLLATATAILVGTMGMLVQQQYAHEQTAWARGGQHNKLAFQEKQPTVSNASASHLSGLADLDTHEFDQQLVKGGSFSAKITVEDVQNLADGTSKTRTSVSLIYRDQEGRTRRDRLDQTQGVTAPVLDRPFVTTINDPVAGFSYTLDPGTSVARRSVFVVRTEPDSNDESMSKGGLVSNKGLLNSQILPLPASDEIGLKLQNAGVVSGSSNVKRKFLGYRQIEGIATEGTRVAMTIPAGMMKNEKPVEIVVERWYSPTLKIAILIEQSDSRFGKSIYQLTDIKAGQPSANLFMVPADYKIRQ